MNYVDIVKIKFCLEGLKMATSSTATAPFVPMRYENFPTIIDDSISKLEFIREELLSEQRRESAIRIRLDMDRNISAYCVDPEKNRSLMHEAAERADVHGLRILIQSGNHSDVQDADGNTPLMILVQKYVEREEDCNNLRILICGLIKAGARVNVSNNNGDTAARLILTSAHEILFFHCLDLPWAEVFLDYFSENEEPTEIVETRFNSLIATRKQSFIKALLEGNFSSRPKGLCNRLELVIKGTAYHPTWLGYIKEDPSEASVHCKMDLLKAGGFYEALQKSYSGLKYNGKYPYLDRWFQKNKPQLASTGSSPNVSVSRMVAQHSRFVSSAPISSPPIPIPVNRRQLLATASTASLPIPTNPRLRQTPSTSSLSLPPSPESPIAPRRMDSLTLSSGSSSPTEAHSPRLTTADTEACDAPQKVHSWSHFVPGRAPLRRRGGTENDLKQAAQSDRAGESERKALDAEVKRNVVTQLVSENREDQESAKKLLMENPRWINQSFDGSFLLFKVVEAGRVGMTKFLLEKGADCKVWGNNRETALHYAVKNTTTDVSRIVKIIGYLLKKDADCMSGDVYKETPVDFAFERGDPNILEPFLDRVESLGDTIEKLIKRGYPKTEETMQCVILALDKGKVSPKLVVLALLGREFDERNVYIRRLLENALSRCERMEEAEMAALASDENVESLDRKLACLKTTPKFYGQIVQLLLALPEISFALLKRMLLKKDVRVVPDYNCIFMERKGRKEKLQLLMDLCMIPKDRKAEQLAAGKSLELMEAFEYGLVPLFPAQDESKWPEMLQAFARGRATLNEIQTEFLRQKMPADGPRVKAIINMLFQQNFHSRSDPLKKSPYEIMLEIIIPRCTQVWVELKAHLKNDLNPESVKRKLEICRINEMFFVLLNTHIEGKVALSSSPPERESLSSGSSSRSRSGSRPGSGSTTPRGSSRK